ALASDHAVRDRPYFTPSNVGGLVVQRLPFFSLRSLDLIRHTARFRFLVHDVTEPPPTTATIVRAVNIITLEYFDLATATHAIANALQAVEPGGYFVAGQSRGLDPAAMRATVFRVHGNVADVVARVGKGYELEETVRSQAARMGWGRACE